MREASFGSAGSKVGPVTLEVAAGEHTARAFASPREASIVALLAAGIVKASSGSVLLDQYDPRVQSAHCKRIAAFVPHAPLPLEDAEFERYIAYRAALWNVEPMRAVAHAKLLLERLDGMHEAFAFSLAAALVGGPKILVLDRPQAAYVAQIMAAAGPRAIFSTHVSAAAADRFSQSKPQEARA